MKIRTFLQRIDHLNKDLAVLGAIRVREASAVPNIDQAEVYTQYLDLVDDQDLIDFTESLFVDGHYARAVEEAFKCLNNTVKRKAGSSADGADLMRSAFSPKKPTLKLNRFRSETDKSEQQGYMDLFAGSMTGIRNPRAHEHELQDHPEIALELVVFANHLMRKAKSATRTRQRRAKTK